MDSTWQNNETGETEQGKVPRRESQLNPVAAEFTPAAFSNMTNLARPRSNVQSAPRFQSVDEGPVSHTTNLETAQAACRQSGLPYRLRDSVPGNKVAHSRGEGSSSGVLSQKPRRKRQKTAGAGNDESQRTAQSSRQPRAGARNVGRMQNAQSSRPRNMVNVSGGRPYAPRIPGQTFQYLPQQPVPPRLVPPQITPQVVNESPPISPRANDPLMQAIREIAARPVAPLWMPNYAAQASNPRLQAYHNQLTRTYGPAAPPPPAMPEAPQPPEDEPAALQTPDEPEIAPHAHDSPWRDTALSPLPAPALVRPPRPARFIIGPSESPTTVASPSPESRSLAEQLAQVRENRERSLARHLADMREKRDRELERQRLIYLQLGLIDISTVNPSPAPQETMERNEALVAGRTPTPVIVDGRTNTQRYDDPLPQTDWTPAEGGDPSGARRQMAVVEHESSSAPRQVAILPSSTPARQRPIETQYIYGPLSDLEQRIDVLERARDAPSDASSSWLTTDFEPDTEDAVIEEPQREEPQTSEPPVLTPFEPLPILIRGLLHPRQDPAPPLTAERGRRRDEHHHPTVFNLDPRAGSEEAVASSPERPSSRTQRRRRRWRREERGESSHESDRSR